MKLTKTKGKRARAISEPVRHSDLVKPAKPSIREIRGIHSAWAKAEKYVLRLNATATAKLFVAQDGRLVEGKKNAIRYAKGYDDPEVKRQFWESKLSVKLLIETL